MDITLPEVAERLKQRAGFSAGLGDKAMEVAQAYAKAFPDKKPVEIWSMVSSNRQGVVTLADAKVKQPAPVFVSWFSWQPPLFDGRIGAFHCVDICFWFYNTDVMLFHTGGGPGRKRSRGRWPRRPAVHEDGTTRMAQGLRLLPKYTMAKGEVLVLDDVCVAKNDPDREARKALPRT